MGHSFTTYEPNTDATCIADSTKIAFCDHGCGTSDVIINEGTLDPDAHSLGEWITEGNKSTRICELCGYTETKVTTDDGDVEIEAPNQPDLDFDVDQLNPSDDNYILVEEILTDMDMNYEILKIFDINLKNSDGVHVQPNGSVKVKLPHDWSRNGTYKVYQVNDDGTLTDMSAYRQGSHIVFDTDHFSFYVIVEEKTSDSLPGDLNGDGIVTDDDVALLLWHTLFPEDFEILGNADFTGDGQVTDDDVAYLLWHTLFPEDFPL